MALGVCLLFDSDTETAMRRLWDRLETRGITSLRGHTHGGHRPHVSYSVLLDWDLDKVRTALEELPEGEPLALDFHGAGSFPRGKAWLAPGVSVDLARRQAAVDTAVRGTGATVHDQYVPGTWLAHCTVAPRVRLDQQAALAAEAYAVLPLTATVTAAALIDASTGNLWPLTHVP